MLVLYMAVQMGYAGCRPTALQKSDGEFTQSPEDVKTVWYQCSTFPAAILKMPLNSCQLSPQTWNRISVEELTCALSKMKNGRAGGKTRILPELLLAGGAELLERMHKVMESVWRPFPRRVTSSSMITGALSVCWMWW